MADGGGFLFMSTSWCGRDRYAETLSRWRARFYLCGRFHRMPVTIQTHLPTSPHIEADEHAGLGHTSDGTNV